MTHDGTAGDGPGLVYHAGALGDFITALPAIARFRASRPRLVYLGRPAHAELATHLFDETGDPDAPPWSRLFSGTGGRTDVLRERLRGITSALLFASPRSPLPSALNRLGVRDVVRQDPFPSTAIPVVDYHLSLFPGPFREEDRIPRLGVPPVEGPQSGTAIAFGSGSPKKNWPLDRFSEVAARLAARGESVWWIEGPAERERSPAPPAQTWSLLPLVELASRLSGCRLFLGNDSGVAHLAAAMGCASVVLFGPSNPRIWSPRGKQVRVIVSPSGDLDDIDTGDVLRTCLDFLEKK